MEDNLVEAKAAQRARLLLHKYNTEPPTVTYPISPLATHTSPSPDDESAGVTAAPVLLVSSPYPKRRATLVLRPHDKPTDSEASTVDETPSLATSADESTSHHTVRFVRPLPLPPPAEGLHNSNTKGNENHVEQRCAIDGDGTSGNGPSCAGAAADDSLTSVPHRSIPRLQGSPYSQLSYIFGDTCCPFTALLATLRAAGFTRVQGRKALLHKTHSLLWVKHLMPSTVDQLMGQLGQLRKVNHFPATHWLGRKDKLCLLLRQAAQRWDTGNADEKGEYSRLTPETWLLPADGQALRAALRRRQHTTAASNGAEASTLFIVKPANNAGGQGIFLVDAGCNEAGACAAEDALAAAGARLSPSPPSGGPADHSAAPLSAATVATARPSGGSADGTGFVVQRYMANPFLIAGHKFDLRLYVVVTSYEPVRMYVYREGLVRIASSPYHSVASEEEAADRADASGTRRLADLQQLRAHLTNFTVNKTAAQSPGTQDGHDAAAGDGETTDVDTMEPKWSFEALGEYMSGVGYSWGGTWQRIQELLRRAFLSVTPHVRAELRAATRRAAGLANGADQRQERCESAPVDAAVCAPPPCTAGGIGPFFEFFGVDVLLVHEPSKSSDEAATLRPVLLEINILPSLSTHYSLFDQRVKANFIADALTLVGLTSPLFKTQKPTTARAAGAAGEKDETLSKAKEPPREDGEENGSPADALSDWIAEAFAGDVHAQEACYTATEESRRAPNFTRLIPTATSATQYAALMVDRELGVEEPSRYDAILSSWVAAQSASS